AAHAARLLPPGAHVLDIGSGDGLLAMVLARMRPDLEIEGVDILIRDQTWFPVREFDGWTIPPPARSVDAVTFFDVLHHANDPFQLLAEAARVATTCIVLKDHLREGLLAGSTLRLMDHIGNARHGVALPNNYWTAGQWTSALDALKLSRRKWQTRGLGL